jgi:peptidoglycan/LPS O-acetylase OafA/YrhL
MEAQPAATGDSAKKRIPELDGLRAVAIAAVFLHHACRAPLLWAGVDIFFVLSGFLITGILLERKAKGGAYFRYFYERRVRRILPPYYLALLLSSLLFGWAWLHRWYWFAFFATNIGESIRRSHFSLQPLWSLAVEEQFYFVWPVVILLVSEKNLRRICIAMLFVAPLLRILCTPLFHNHFPIYFLTPFRADLLCAGALIALLWRDDRVRLAAWSRWGWGLVVVGMAVLGWVSLYPAWRAQSNTREANGGLYSITLVISVGLLLWALRGEGWFCAVLRWRPMRYLGFISYSMYLVHTSFIMLGRQWFGDTTWKIASVAAVMTVAYGSVAWFGWERRILHWGLPSGQALPTAETEALHR